MKPVHQSLLVEENVAPRLCGGEKKPRELIIYVFHTALIFPLPSKIFEESAGFYLVGDFGGKRGTRWISFCRDRWNNRKSVDLERLSWINFRTIGWICNSIETCNAKSDD